MIDVMIIENEQEERLGLQMLIQGTHGFRCANTYSDCESALASLENDLPDVILLDIGLPGMDGVQGVREIKKSQPDVEVIMLTIKADSDHIFESLRNGASGYLLKPAEPADLLRAIREVYDGGSPMSMSIARKVTKSFKRSESLDALSNRENEVLQLLCDGKSYMAIANALFIAKDTVKFHIRNIYKKLRVKNKAEVIRKATKAGLI